jgi:hypothetical protein
MMRFLSSLAVALLLFPSVAHAYLNPDQGSIFLQLLLGGIAGGAVMFRVYWRRIVALLTRQAPPEKSIDD